MALKLTRGLQQYFYAVGFFGLLLSPPAKADANLTGTGLTLAKLAPAMLQTMGYADPAYSSMAMATSPVTPVAGDAVSQFVAPDGQTVTAVVQSPVTTKTYAPKPIATSQTAEDYFKQIFTAAGSGAAITIPYGIYNFSGACTNQAVLLTSVHDVIVDGQGSILNFSADCVGVKINAATRVIFKNFIIDWPNLRNAVVAKVTAVRGDAKSGYSFDMQAPAAQIVSSFDTADEWDAANNYWSLANHNEVFYTTPHSFAPTGLAANLPMSANQFNVGDSLLVRHRGTGSAFVVWMSQDVTFDTVTVRSAPSMGFLIAYGRGVHLNHCQVVRTNNRPISTTADAVHFGSYGGDVIIENSYFAYQGDDGLNLHTAMATVAAGGASSLALPVNFAANGDIIALFDANMVYVGRQAASCASTACAVNVAPIAAKGGYVSDLNLAAARYIIISNQFAHNRARGALLQSPYGLVQWNTFVGQSLFGLYIVESSYWNEGAGAQNLLVAYNSFSAAGAGVPWGMITVAREGSRGLIYAPATAASPAPTLAPVHQNLVFAGNKIQNTPGAAFYISSANNVVLYQNTMANTNFMPVNAAPNPNAPVVLYDAANVLLQSNSIGATTGSSILLDASDMNVQAK